MLKFTAQVHLHLCLQWTKIFFFLRVHYEAHYHSLQVEKVLAYLCPLAKEKARERISMSIYVNYSYISFSRLALFSERLN